MHYTYLTNSRINKLLLPCNLYSGAKHISLSSQRPCHFFVLLAPFFHSAQANTIFVPITIQRQKHNLKKFILFIFQLKSKLKIRNQNKRRVLFIMLAVSIFPSPLPIMTEPLHLHNRRY